MTTPFHTPVLTDQVLQALDVTPSEKYIDATLGGGGHSLAILNLGGQVLAFDQDSEAIAAASTRFSPKHQIHTIKASFTNLESIATQHHFNQVSGIIFDLGVSSHQLTSPDRGFSFNSSSDLDMRMDRDLAVTAKDLLAVLSKKELIKLFTLYADESHAHQIAEKITTTRKSQPITTTDQLRRIIHQVKRPRPGQTIDPATQVFQALRIAVNDELNALKQTLPQAVNLLKPGGILAVISFHSGEDQIVKHFIRDHPHQLEELTKKPIQPTSEEIKQNPRARSAKLRLGRKK